MEAALDEANAAVVANGNAAWSLYEELKKTVKLAKAQQTQLNEKKQVAKKLKGSDGKAQTAQVQVQGLKAIHKAQMDSLNVQLESKDCDISKLESDVAKLEKTETDLVIELKAEKAKNNKLVEQNVKLAGKVESLTDQLNDAKAKKKAAEKLFNDLQTKTIGLNMRQLGAQATAQAKLDASEAKKEANNQTKLSQLDRALRLTSKDLLPKPKNKKKGRRHRRHCRQYDSSEDSEESSSSSDESSSSEESRRKKKRKKHKGGGRKKTAKKKREMLSDDEEEEPPRKKKAKKKPIRLDSDSSIEEIEDADDSSNSHGQTNTNNNTSNLTNKTNSTNEEE